VSRSNAPRERLPKGVTALPKSRGGRPFLASIRRGKGQEVHLGLYESPWLAAFAHGIAARAIGRGEGPPVEIPLGKQPTAEEVRAITAKVRLRLGLDRPPPRQDLPEPDLDDLLTFFEVTVVGFWRSQAADDSWGHPGEELDAAAGQLVAAARLLFRSRTRPTPLDAMTRLLGRRLDAVFRRSDVTGAVLDDDGDDLWRVARWLVHPDAFAVGRSRGFRDEIVELYPDLFEVGDASGPVPAWADVLRLLPPFSLDRVRSAYRARSRTAHPDVGGSREEFVRLQAAYEEAKAFCEARMR
jgi:hypothetical protein